MGSMVNGLIVGALATGYVVMQYGESPGRIGSRVGDYLARSIAAGVPENATALTGGIGTAPDPQEVPASPAAMVHDQPPAVGEAEHTGATLEARWAAFAAGPPPVPEDAEFPWRHCFRRAAASYDLPEPLLLAVASGESGFDAAARSPKDAVGLMQIRWPQTGRHLGIFREADLYDPCTNVDAGARYLRELLSLFGNDLHLSLAAYNYGPSRISADAMPEGARWYSQYIYQHLQQVLGADHVPSSELLRRGGDSTGGHLVLMRFNRPQRASDFVRFLQSQLPELDIQQQSELLGQQEVVLLYRDQGERERALASLAAAGLESLVGGARPSHSL